MDEEKPLKLRGGETKVLGGSHVVSSMGQEAKLTAALANIEITGTIKKYCSISAEGGSVTIGPSAKIYGDIETSDGDINCAGKIGKDSYLKARRIVFLDGAVVAEEPYISAQSVVFSSGSTLSAGVETEDVGTVTIERGARIEPGSNAEAAPELKAKEEIIFKSPTDGGDAFEINTTEENPFLIIAAPVINAMDASFSGFPPEDGYGLQIHFTEGFFAKTVFGASIKVVELSVEKGGKHEILPEMGVDGLIGCGVQIDYGEVRAYQEIQSSTIRSKNAVIRATDAAISNTEITILRTEDDTDFGGSVDANVINDGSLITAESVTCNHISGEETKVFTNALLAGKISDGANVEVLGENAVANVGIIDNATLLCREGKITAHTVDKGTVLDALVVEAQFIDPNAKIFANIIVIVNEKGETLQTYRSWPSPKDAPGNLGETEKRIGRGADSLEL